MLASEILKRIIPSGAALDVQALGALDVTGLVTMKGGNLGSFFVSPEVSLSTNGATVDFPAVAGFIPPWIQSKWLITSVTGTATSNPSTKAGNNASFDNLYGPASVPATGSINIGVRGLSAVTINSSTAAGLIDLTTPIRVTVVTGATGTGGFQAKGRLLLWCGLTPV